MSDTVFRVTWMPGTDELLGVCHCGAERLAGEPVELWAWLLGHPDGHEPLAAPVPRLADAGAQA
ncbi:MAG TPA: hypothetical protein VHC23_06420 [Jatrophihabitans sp.]|nr:hypothetical protein [Jatrophihabitans sp.]